jgi:hypothetical protein
MFHPHTSCINASARTALVPVAEQIFDPEAQKLSFIVLLTSGLSRKRAPRPSRARNIALNRLSVRRSRGRKASVSFNAGSSAPKSASARTVSVPFLELNDSAFTQRSIIHRETW